MSYNPKPPLLEIPVGLIPLIDRMGARIHDAWAAHRISEGWTHGPLRDDLKKEHPCLVPWDDLTVAEQEVDLVTARTAIAAIVEIV